MIFYDVCFRFPCTGCSVYEEKQRQKATNETKEVSK